MAYQEFEVSRDEVLKRFDEINDTSEIYAYGCYEKSESRYVVQVVVISLMLLFMISLFAGFFRSMLWVDSYAAVACAVFAALHVMGLVFVIKTYVKKIKKEYSYRYFVFTDTFIGIVCDDCKPDYYNLSYISQMHFNRGALTDSVKIEYLHMNMTDVDTRIVIYGFHNSDELCERYTGRCGARIYLDGRRVR